MAEHAFGAWESFYVIVGSSAGALIGLQFVVIALIADSSQQRTEREIDAYATPTIFHFGEVLLVSAILSAPWELPRNAGRILAATGAGGLTYIAITINRMLRQVSYRPLMEDWLWYVVWPAVGYASLIVAGLTLVQHTHGALFTIGAAALLLLFIGIRNAWDTVTYVAVGQREEQNKPT